MGLLTRAILSHPEYHPSFFFCCRATMGISREAGSSFCAVVHARIKAEGTMIVLRCIMPCMASCTQNSGVMPLRANTTPARSLNSVSTGPGQSAHT